MRRVSIGPAVRVEPRLRVPQAAVDLDRSLLRRWGGGAVRRSRRSLWLRLLKPFAVALLVVGLPAALAAWLMISPRFAVRELAVDTGERVSESWIREALAPVVGENLPLLPLARAERLLRRHPWVRGADLRKDLPARLRVRVTERRAVALLRTDGELHYLDTEGLPIAELDPRAQVADLPLISVADGGLATASSPVAEGDRAATLRSAVRLLSEIDDVEPSWAAGLSEVEILGEEDFRVHTAKLSFPVLVRAGTLHLKARRLEALLPQIVERYGAAAAIDLRFARRIIVQPSVETGAGPRLSRPVPKTEHQEAATDHAQRG